MKAIKQFEKSKADYLVLMGDLLYHGPRNPLPEGYQPQEVYELLNKYADSIIAVRGNCDAEVDQMVLEFNISDDYNFLTIGNHLVYLSHGHIYDPDNLPPGLVSSDVFVFGHIHLPIIEKKNDLYILNPGSCTLPKENYPPSYAIIDEVGITIYDLDSQVIKSMDFD